MEETQDYQPTEAETFVAPRTSAEDVDIQPKEAEKIYDDPSKYLREFEKEIGFNEQVEKRVKNFLAEHPGENLSLEDRQDIAEAMRGKEYKTELWRFWDEHPLQFNPESLPEEAKNAIFNYWGFSDTIKKELREGLTDKDDIVDMDFRKSSLHHTAAQELVKAGIAPDISIGRVLIQFYSVAKGYEAPDPDRDETRIAGYL